MTSFRQPSRTTEDPVFGTLKLNPRFGWEGEVVSPVGDEKLSVSISRGEQEPTVEDRMVFIEFRANYPHLVPLLSTELVKLLEPSLRLRGWEGPSPSTADELWPMLRLEVVYIFPGKPLQLLFAFRGDVWPDAMFNVALDGIHVEGLSLDD